MRRMLLVLSALVLVGMVLPAARSVAAERTCVRVERSKIVSGKITTWTVKKCRDAAPGSTTTGNGAGTSNSSSAPTSACSFLASLMTLDPELYCPSNRTFAVGSGGAGAPLTRASISRAFTELPLPPSKLIVQPPDGLTLVNFDTNFYVAERILRRNVTLLGQTVQLRIWASSYTWRFGDGQALTTTDPGAPYPDLRVTHNYLLKGTYRPRVDTTYQAEFRVAGGRWQPVAGTATVTGESQQLRAIEAQPKLVGPYGRGD